MKTINKFGGGNNTNIHGLEFEQTTSLREAILKIPDMKIEDNKVYRNNDLIGYIFEPIGESKQNKNFYDFLLKEFAIDGKSMLHKTIHPDKIFYNVMQKRFYVIECKFQRRGGSVDEKLQTFPYKRSILNYLLFISDKAKDVDLEYVYVLNSDYFNKKIKNGKLKGEQTFLQVFKYIREHGSNYYFDKIPLNKIGIY